MARIAYFVHGRGRGHAVRSRAVLARLDAEGHQVQLYGGGASVSLLGDRPDFTAVPMTAPGPGLLPALAARLPADLRRLRAFRPAVVVSDSDLSSVHAALLLGIPSIAIGHGLVFGHAVLPPWLPRSGVWRETINSGSSSWPAWRVVVVHFAEVPLRGRRAVLARPDLRDGLAPSTGDDGFILAYFRDDNGGPLLERLLRRGERVVCFTRGPVPPGVDARPPSAEAFARALTRCRAVVASAGNHLPAECAMVGKPLLGVHAPGDVEQAMNAALLAEAGLGMASPLDAVDDRLLDRFFEETLPRPGAADRVRRLPPASEVVAGLVAERATEASGSGAPR
ncbi:MAG TPA: glycosyltransferase family protein [Polyangiaceae bacterium LLY-WYZ-14_1]|nr:glycosyltransferase family protein [Polyangiaceae bacterium LLY-WYZ-14_1]